MNTTAAPAEMFQDLRQCGYNEANLRRLLRVRDLPLITPLDRPSYLERMLGEKNGALALSAAFWLLHQPIRERQLAQLHGPDGVEQLRRLGVIQESSLGAGVLEALVDLYPCGEDFIFTDPHLALGYKNDHVYQLGTDSYVLARVTPRSSGAAALDLCTGSGVHAVQSAHHYAQSIGIDVNPRALDFARRNAELNGVGERCRFLQGDLYGPVEGMKFDLITINPPFVPTPDEDMHIHRTGGESGEIISERAVAGLPQFLQEGGTFSMVLDFPVMMSSTYLQRLCSWLGAKSTPAPGWGVAVLNFGHASIERYIKEHVDSSDINAFHQMYQRYLNSYQRQGIYEVGFANVFIRRLQPDHPGFAVEHVMVNPYEEIQPLVEVWLRAWSRRDWGEYTPQLSPWVGDLWLNHRGDKGQVEFTQPTWSGTVAVPGDWVHILKLVNGRLTGGALAERWAKKKKMSVELARQQVTLALAGLGTRLLVI